MLMMWAVSLSECDVQHLMECNASCEEESKLLKGNVDDVITDHQEVTCVVTMSLS